MAGFTIAHEDTTLRIATVRNVLVVVWRDAPTLVQMRAFSGAARAIHRAYPGDAGLINAILSGTPRFSDGVRDEAVRLSRENLLPRGAVHLIVIGGLAGAAARAFMSTVVLLARAKVPTRVSSDPKDACAWLSPLVSVGKEPWTSEGLLAVYQQVAAR